MSSGSKFARGTGRGQFRPPHNRGLVQLRHGPASSKKTSLGQGRDISGPVGAGNGGTSNNSREESFQLLPQPSTMGRPFAMIIRLQPEILEELKQAEAEGIQASMKFGANATGHVIQVGSETFKFSSAPEPGDLCDIYEQKQGETGEAVLVEAGSAWRKLSVQRILSATEKDRVKKRTAEAEHRQKQRKAILVDPSTQMIIPQAGAAEANGRKPLPKLMKEPPPKKRRVTMSPLKQRPHSSTAVASGNRQFASPASPSFDPPGTNVRGTQANQMSDSHPPKARAVSERIGGPIPSKGPSLQKEKPRTPVASAASDSAKSGSATNLTDLRNFLIGLMQENPKGVTIKAIEKAVAEGLSGVADKRAFEKVMKSIASFHAPGKYLLNPGVEKGNYLEPVSASNSVRPQEAVRPITHEAEPSNGILEKEAAKDKEELSLFEKGLSSAISHHFEHSTKETSPKHGGAQPLDSNIRNEDLTKLDATHLSKDPSTGGSESSSSSGSGSGSDSDSESSGSGSGTDSGSGSGSGSDSDSSSSSSGPSMDEDVDIMSDDDVEKGKSDAKQKLKGRESKSLVREDNKTHETNKSEEETHTSSLDNPLERASALDQAIDPGLDAMAKVSENIIESVFGSDEVDDFGEDSEEPMRGDQSKQGQVAPLQYEERKVPAKAQTSKDPKERISFEETQRILTRDNDALGIEEELDILVEKISESKDMEYGSLGNNRGGLSSSQQEHHKPQSKSGGPGPGKDNENRRMDDVSRSNLDKRDSGVHPSSDGRSALISGKNSRDFETQHLQQRDVGGPNKGNVHRGSRESSYLSGRHDRDSPNVEKSSKVLRQSRQKTESFDRAGLVVEQAERPLADTDSTRRGKEMHGKGTFKETESGGRLSSGEPSSVVPKETTRFGESGQNHGRGQVRENCRPVSQVVEMRDLPFENGNLELKKGLPSMEDSRSKATSGTKSRLPYKGSTSPDQDDFLPLDRRSLELAKQSPVKIFEDSRHHAYEARSAKRRPEEVENPEMERSKKRAGAAHIRQPQHREEWFQGGSIKQNHTEKGRFTASDSQEYAGTSKFSALENSIRSDEELEELYRQQRVSQTRAASSEMRRDNLKAGDSLDNSKRQTPQSTEEVEGCEFFAPYEKKNPDLRGSINTFQEYKEYCKEYREKYPIYIRLNGVIENNKRPFESLRKDMERARNKDDEKKLAHTCAKVRREYAVRHKKRERMIHTFRILHEELKAIKTRCKEFAEKVGQG